MRNNNKDSFSLNRILVYIIVALGWASSGYLFLRSRNLANGIIQESDLCKSIFRHSCDQILLNSVSWQLDYPLAGWGLIYFAIIGFIFVFRKQLSDQAAFVASLFGAGINIVLAATELLEVIPFCPLCLTINFLSIILPIPLWMNIRNNVAENKADNWPSRLSFKLLLPLVFICGIVLQLVIVRTGPIKEEQIRYEKILEDFRSETVFEFPVESHSPILGNADAPVQLVVFSSFQCPSCMVFAYSLQYLHAKYKDNIAVVFKNFPLSTKCNPALSENMQPRACEAAIAAMAANQQSQFWTYHNSLFASDLSASNEILKSSARLSNLDLSIWGKDLQSDEIWEQLKTDISLGYEVGVIGTPTVFLNGRKVEDFQLPVIQFLINMELKAIRN